MICKTAKGKFIATTPIKGGLSGANPSDSPCPKTCTTLGDYHTHGNYSLSDGTATTPDKDQYDSLHFSSQDVKTTLIDMKKNPDFTSYLGTPNGGYYKYVPTTNPSQVPLK